MSMKTETFFNSPATINHVERPLSNEKFRTKIHVIIAYNSTHFFLSNLVSAKILETVVGTHELNRSKDIVDS